MDIIPANYDVIISLGSLKNVCLSGVFDMFLLVSVVLIDFLTITLISQCDELAMWMESAFRVSLQLSNALYQGLS